MRGTVNFLKGTARVELRCRYSERAVNICARNHVDFWDLRRGPEGQAVMTVSLPGYMRLRRVAGETGAFTVRIVGRRGVPFFLWRIRKRYALLVGMALCLGLVGLSSLFVWQIDVVGAETVSSSKILAALRREGVDIGVCVLDINEKLVANNVMLDVPELSFVALNNHGSRIEVIVREKVPAPELYDPEVPTSVYAVKPGIITDIYAREGWMTVEPGDTVDAGDELISARVPIGAGYLTHAAGEVEARTWYSLSLKMPLGQLRKTYTGRERTKRAIIFGGKRINLYFMGGNPYTSCDKITVYKKLTLPGGAVLPVTVVTERYREYETSRASLTREYAGEALRARLLAAVQERIGGGSVTATDFTESVEGGVMTVTLTAECLEQIGAERALTE